MSTEVMFNMGTLLEKLRMLAEYAELAQKPGMRANAEGALIGLAPHLISLHAEMEACVEADTERAKAGITQAEARARSAAPGAPVRTQEQWDSLHTRLLDAHGAVSLLAYALPEAGDAPLTGPLLSLCSMLEKHLRDMLEAF